MELIDTHCHFDLPIFNNDRHELVHRASALGINRLIMPAIAYKNWDAIKNVQRQYDNDPKINLYAAYGLHPMFISQHEDEHLQALRYWLEHERPIAVGECGLDFFVKDLDQQRQMRIFSAQVALAAEYDLPLIIHARKSLDSVMKVIRQQMQRSRTHLRGVIHSFSGSEQQAKQCIELGFYLGFGGPMTYPRAKKLRHLVASLPLEALLLETDAPDQPDVACHGQRNEPARLLAIAETFATLRQQPLQTIAEVTTQNAKTLFNLP